MAASPYKYPLKHYVSVYGVSYRQVLRYKDQGFNLDDKDGTELLIATGGKPIPPSAANGPSSPPSGTGGARGLVSALARLETEEAEAHARYKQALADGNESLAESRRKQWEGLLEALRKAAQSSPAVAEANKSIVNISDVAAELSQAFARLRKGLDSLPQRVALELVGRDEIGIKERLTRETEEMIAALYSCTFLNPAAGNDE